MQFIVDNWYLIVAGIVLVVAAISLAVWFFKLPTATQIKNIKEWLKFAVIEAEKALGSGTGQLKLRLVYDMAVEKFPWIAVISFDTFSTWVDEALEWMKGQLETNKAVQDMIKGE